MREKKNSAAQDERPVDSRAPPIRHAMRAACLQTERYNDLRIGLPVHLREAATYLSLSMEMSIFVDHHHCTTFAIREKFLCFSLGTYHIFSVLAKKKHYDYTQIQFSFPFEKYGSETNAHKYTRTHTHLMITRTHPFCSSENVYRQMIEVLAFLFPNRKIFGCLVNV